MNGFKIIVLAKQVPDTRNVGKDAMKEDGTVNRAALPAIFNREDLISLEQAFRIKEAHPGSTLTILTMGPGRAADIIREALFRGADDGFLLTDRAFAGSDTLATSYALAKAIEKIGRPDLIVCGRQAIDGDTAQVGPQVAEKLGFPQITYAEEVNIEGDVVRVKRRLERGIEIVKASLPLLITVNGSAPECRPRNARMVMRYKKATTLTERQSANEDYLSMYTSHPYLNIEEIGFKDLDANIDDCGLAGSPTKVKKIENVVFQAKESMVMPATDHHLDALMKELIINHTLG